MRRIGRSLVAAALTLVVSCGPPEEARIEASDRVEALPPPELEPTSEFDAARAAAEPEADELLAGAEELQARAEALRARAAALSSETVDP